MAFNVLGKKARLDVVVISMIVGGVVALSLLCNVQKESFSNRNRGQVIGSSLRYSMGDGVPVSYATSANRQTSCQDWFAPLAGNVQGRRVPLPEGELAIFATNTQSPQCCPSTYSGSMGCVCETEPQMKYLNERGGNRTSCSLY